jgi:hypothetical protein
VILTDETLGNLRARVFGWCVSVHRVQVTNGGFDSSRGAGAGLIDESGLLCLAGVIGQSRSLDDLELVVGAFGDSLQVVLEIGC